MEHIYTRVKSQKLYDMNLDQNDILISFDDVCHDNDDFKKHYKFALLAKIV